MEYPTTNDTAGSVQMSLTIMQPISNPGRVTAPDVEFDSMAKPLRGFLGRMYFAALEPKAAAVSNNSASSSRSSLLLHAGCTKPLCFAATPEDIEIPWRCNGDATAASPCAPHCLLSFSILVGSGAKATVLHAAAGLLTAVAIKRYFYPQLHFSSCCLAGFVRPMVPADAGLAICNIPNMLHAAVGCISVAGSFAGGANWYTDLYIQQLSSSAAGFTSASKIRHSSKST